MFDYYGYDDDDPDSGPRCRVCGEDCPAWLTIQPLGVAPLDGSAAAMMRGRAVNRLTPLPSDEVMCSAACAAKSGWALPGSGDAPRLWSRPATEQEVAEARRAVARRVDVIDDDILF